MRITSYIDMGYGSHYWLMFVIFGAAAFIISHKNQNASITGIDVQAKAIDLARRSRALKFGDGTYHDEIIMVKYLDQEAE